MSLDIADRIRRHGFKRLLLAVSGGLDSICLAHYFTQNRETLGIEWLGIAHVHHGLRVGTADRDAAFVESFAKSHGIPFFLKKLDGEALKAAEGSLEENARDARYKALIEIASTQSNRICMDPAASRQDDIECIIVTAHHAGDQAETIYMRIRRGTTLAGLRGIQEVRNSTILTSSELESMDSGCVASRMTIYRPFLNVTRAELLAYAKENNLTWCEDESNSDIKFARNKVRHEWLPQLEQSNAGVTKQLCKIAVLADRAYGKVMATCEALFSQSLKEIPGQAREDKEGGSIALDKKSLRKILLAHADTDLSEMFRLWLSEQGFRFPIGFFYDQNEPAHVKIPVRAAYRKRSIVKKGSTVFICEFKDAVTALNFVSCKMKD